MSAAPAAMQRREEKLEGEEANGDHRGAHQNEEKRMVPTARHGAAGVGAELPRTAGGVGEKLEPSGASLLLRGIEEGEETTAVL